MLGIKTKTKTKTKNKLQTTKQISLKM